MFLRQISVLAFSRKQQNCLIAYQPSQETISKRALKVKSPLETFHQSIENQYLRVPTNYPVTLLQDLQDLTHSMELSGLEPVECNSIPLLHCSGDICAYFVFAERDTCRLEARYEANISNFRLLQSQPENTWKEL